VHCKASLEAMKKAVATNSKVRFSFIEYPILTADSLVAARAAVAARQQPGKYVPFHVALMATSGDLPKERILAIAKTSGLDVAKLAKDMDDPAVTASIDASHALAQKLHVDGTPTFVINGQFWVGELTDAKLQSLIKAGES
jgi:protein-disulfide isomerase